MASLICYLIEIPSVLGCGTIGTRLTYHRYSAVVPMVPECGDNPGTPITASGAT